MISSLRGHIEKYQPGLLEVVVQGVGYRVTVPLQYWDELSDLSECKLFIRTYVREDRLDLFGFPTQNLRSLFDALIEVSGIGPRMAMEICSVSPVLLREAVTSHDSSLLTSIKGIGRKMAEKLHIELKSLNEKHPHLLTGNAPDAGNAVASIDTDAILALQALGYDQVTIVSTLSRLPQTLQSTEARVTAALQHL